MNQNKKGVAEWYWIIIMIIIAIVVALFVLTMFTDFGYNIKDALSGIFDLTNTSNLNSPPS